MDIVYSTACGQCIVGKSEKVLTSADLVAFRGKVNLVFTSPPFPLRRKKKYGNRQGEAYIDWIGGFAPILRDFITDEGSIVMEVGNSWEPGEPVMSTLALRALLGFMEAADLRLCQQFIWHNPARLPSPAQWVNIERIRVKDSFTHIWWFAKTTKPKANNRNVLTGYSEAMKKLLRDRKYNQGKRPSEHNIGQTSFFQDNNGAIPSNVLTFANTHSSSPYLRYCKSHDLELHPARMPIALPEFFIKFLTDEGDLVLDPFAGSNTTGAAAEFLGRRWLSVEANAEYARGSFGWFAEETAASND